MACDGSLSRGASHFKRCHAAVVECAKRSWHRSHERSCLAPARQSKKERLPISERSSLLLRLAGARRLRCQESLPHPRSCSTCPGGNDFRSLVNRLAQSVTLSRIKLPLNGHGLAAAQESEMLWILERDLATELVVVIG